MNIYRCWYQGISGFAVRQGHNTWKFVPDPGQNDPRIQHQLQFSDLVFSNRREYEYELERQTQNRFSLLNLIRNFLFPFEPAATTAGELLLPPGR